MIKFSQNVQWMCGYLQLEYQQFQILSHVMSCHVMSRHVIWLRHAHLWAWHSVSAFRVFLGDDLIQQTRVEIHEGIHKMHVGGIDEELALVT